jgi:hypothetical protein
MDEPLTASPVTQGLPATLPVVRYRFTVRLRQPLEWPPFPGALLRSVFGMSLRRLSCMTGAERCTGCDLLRTCPYPALFETPSPSANGLQPGSSLPNPYVIEPPEDSVGVVPPGGIFQFNVVLFGEARRQLALVRRAIEAAVQAGLGPARARGELLCIDTDGAAGWVSIWRSGESRLADHATQLVMPGSRVPAVTTLQLLTPLRLQQQGRPLQAAEVSMRKFVGDLLRRTTLLLESHTGERIDASLARALLADAEALREKRDLKWQDLSRYSARQRQEMTLGGLRGTWRVEGDLSGIYPLLFAGQWLHAGKNTTMGHGRYRLT